MIRLSVDEQSGIILVVSIGEASRAEIDRHYDRLRDVIAGQRKAGRPVRVLSDQRQATRLRHELNLHLKKQIDRTAQDGDRWALLMRDPEDQEYARTILGIARYAVFTSEIAAQIWLTEECLRPPGKSMRPQI